MTLSQGQVAVSPLVLNDDHIRLQGDDAIYHRREVGV